MAFYHVGSCDCPEGCCDCGTEYIYFNRWRNKIETFVSGYSFGRIKSYHVFIGEL